MDSFTERTQEAIEVAKVRDLCRSGVAGSVRRAGGQSLREVATVVGVAPSTVLRWERNERSPRGKNALAYGRLLQGLIDR